MKIYRKDTSSRLNFFKNYRKIKPNKDLLAKSFLLLILGGVFFVPLSLLRSDSNFLKNSGNYIYKSLNRIDPQYGFLTKDVLSLADNFFGISYRYLRSLFYYRDELKINLNSKNYQKIYKLRNKAIKDSILLRSKEDKVSGFLSYKGKTFPIRLRLKGDWTDHLLGEKWSFRIETKKNKAFKGMTEFSLQHPRTRSYATEYLFHSLLEREGLPFLRYEFLPVYLNGKYLGIYALEEHFGKELIENSKLREGPILKISDKDKRNQWNVKSDQNKIYINPNNFDRFINTTENNAQLLTFNIDKISNKQNKLSQFQLASLLLDDFIRGNKKTSDVFDLNMTAKYFAVLDLLQALGAYEWHDMRFYYDPITARLTPIGYDAQIDYLKKKRYLSIDQNTLKIFDDPKFVSQYSKELYRISSKDYLDNFLLDKEPDLKKELLTINRSYPFVELTYIKDELLKNRLYIRERLFHQEPIGIDSLIYSSDRKSIYVELFNKNKFSLNLDSLILNGELFTPDNDVPLFGGKANKRVKKSLVKFNKVESLGEKGNYLPNLLNEVTLKYKVEDIPILKSINSKVFKKVPTANLSDQLITKNPTYKDFKNLVIDEKNKEIFIKEDITFNKPLILPNEFKLTIFPGVNIKIEGNGLILINGALNINGTDSQKVFIKSMDGGRGISVFNAKEKSIINFANFNNLNANTQSSINITGGLSFYNSEVLIKNSAFVYSQSEDSLNLVRSPFIIESSFFSDNKSDAIDIDFSNGIIKNSTFKNTGNDAVDVSRSEVLLSNIEIIKAGDKGISIGEKSTVYIVNPKISNAFIGIASKDLSKTYVNNLSINNVNICFASYQKKPEYGPGFLKINNTNTNCNSSYLLEEGSSLISSGRNFLPNSNNAYEDLYE